STLYASEGRGDRSSRSDDAAARFCLSQILSAHQRARPAPTTLFPYTTLFRSSRPPRRPFPCGRSRVIADPNPRIGSAITLLLPRSEEHTSELQSRFDLVCRLLLEKKKENQCDLTETPGRKS